MQAAETGRRETRLLIVTITVAAVMLFLLGRFRFPEEAALQPAGPAPAPLERLAARATYDELATFMAEVERRVAPTVVVVPVQDERGETSYVTAVRFSPDRAVAALGPGERIASGTTPGAPAVVGHDPVRNLVVLQVASRPGDVVTPRTGAPRPGPRYVAIVDATQQGVAVRPVYVGRTDVFTDPRTGDSLISINAIQQTVPRGSAVFTLEGTFMGLAIESAGMVSLRPAPVLIAAADAAPAAMAATGHLGIEVQTLSPALARAAGTEGSVIVSYVYDGGPAAGRLLPTDVILAIDGLPVTSVASYEQMVASREPGARVSLTLSRGNKTHTETVQARTPADARGSNDAGGLLLRTVRGAGAEILAVAPGSPAARAGLRAGDVIIMFRGLAAPGAADVLGGYAAANSGESLLLAARRGSEQRVFALEKP